MAESDRIEIEGSRPQGDFYKLTRGETIEGYFKGGKQVPSKFGKDQWIYSIKTAKGVVLVNGSADLDDKMASLAEQYQNHYVWITYVDDMPTNKGNPMKVFKVEASKSKVDDVPF